MSLLGNHNKQASLAARWSIDADPLLMKLYAKPFLVTEHGEDIV